MDMRSEWLMIMCMGLAAPVFGQVTTVTGDPSWQHKQFDVPKVIVPASFHDCSEANPKDYASAFCQSTDPHPECHYTSHHEPTGEKGFECDAIIEYSLESSTGTVVKLLDEEYANLIRLRRAVIDEEDRLAVKYGADVPPLCKNVMSARHFDKTCELMSDGPHYEFRGQFLLIERGQK